MMQTPRPTNAERAEAHDRLITTLDEARDRAYAAAKILREPDDRTRSSVIGPKFPYRGETINALIDKATQALWEAHRLAAGDAYDYHAAAAKEIG